jgi:bifunctional UDP-N-acetylglucosamine pyrophosphorylase/glucosamine-1-phosphate N-acetyltransferase
MSVAYILAAGTGSKIWPYDEIRPKAMLPAANRPLVSYLTESVRLSGVKKIVIGVDKGSAEIRNCFGRASDVMVRQIGSSAGTADTLNRLLSDEEDLELGFFVFYGDTWIDLEDVSGFIHGVANHPQTAAVLLAPIPEIENRDWICARVHDNKLAKITGHPRDGYTHQFAAFYFPNEAITFIQNCGNVFHRVQVGMMVPEEQFLEAALADYQASGKDVTVVETKHQFFDLDKPWHILELNEYLVAKLTSSFTENDLAEGASIDETASIDGFVKLGENSRIGKNVLIRGNLIVGENATIDAGAIFAGNAIIGSDSFVGNYCYIEGGSTIGNRCIVSHCAELSGMIMDNVYLYHYMEIYGLIGESTDIGAATVCGSLRFDDGNTIHRVKGRKELPRNFSNATYLGDFCRTGVNVTIMPGCKVGPYSILGPGVLLEEDVPNRTSIRVKQTLETHNWGPEKYGW